MPCYYIEVTSPWGKRGRFRCPILTIPMSVELGWRVFMDEWFGRAIVRMSDFVVAVQYRLEGPVAPFVQLEEIAGCLHINLFCFLPSLP